MNIELKNYLQDGANWQARCVLCYLQGNIHEIDFLIKDELNLEKNETDIYVGRYENCREQGYVVSLCYKGRRINYAIYEHRNSDELIVLKSNCKTTNTPNVDAMWKDKGENASKYDYDKSFSCGDIVLCGNWIINDMKLFIIKIEKEIFKEYEETEEKIIIK
jgi:hypothetical protein